MSLGTLMGVIAAGAVGQSLMPSTGLIGFRYPVTVSNQPLRHPVRVVAVADKRLTLADGRVFDLDSPDPAWLLETLAESNDQVDVEADADGRDRATFWVSDRRVLCDTGFYHPIQIPLIPVYRQRFRREVLGQARLVPVGGHAGLVARP